MRLRPCTVAAVLAAFLTTTAVPGRQIVVHSHADGDLLHVHASLEHEALAEHEHEHHHHHHDPDAEHEHHHHHAAIEHDDHHDDDHHVGLTEADHAPFEHGHLTSPFQPATPPAPPTVIAAVLVTERSVATPSQPAARGVGRARSRAPPSSARV